MNKATLLSISVAALLIAGCGGGDRTYDTTNIGPDLDFVVPFTCSDVGTFTVGGTSTTTTSQSGNDGYIIYDCLLRM